MANASPGRSGLLILRVWLEDEGANGFRARITQSLDSAAAEHTLATAANADDVYAAVRSWVEGFLGTSR